MPSISLERIRRWAETLGKLGVALNEGQYDQLVRLDRMVVKWNRAAGLTGFRNEEERLDRYFGEALHASMFLPERGQVVDVGSGGGILALPMAVHRPDLEWTLLEPNHKKTVFLQEACARLQLENIKVVRSRFQELEVSAPVAAITVRGLGLDQESLEVFGQWLQQSGRLIFMTGETAGRKILDGGLGGWTIEKQEALAPRFQAVVVVLRRE